MGYATSGKWLDAFFVSWIEVSTLPFSTDTAAAATNHCPFQGSLTRTGAAWDLEFRPRIMTWSQNRQYVERAHSELARNPIFQTRNVKKREEIQIVSWIFMLFVVLEVLWRLKSGRFQARTTGLWAGTGSTHLSSAISFPKKRVRKIQNLICIDIWDPKKIQNIWGIWGTSRILNLWGIEIESSCRDVFFTLLPRPPLGQLRPVQKLNLGTKESERKNVQESKHVTRCQKMSKHEPPQKPSKTPNPMVFLGFDLWFQRLWSSSHWVAALNQPDLGPSLVALVVGDGMSRCGFISYFVTEFANSDFDIEFHNLNYNVRPPR